MDVKDRVLTAREVREIAGLGDRGKWPLSMTADDALRTMRENLHRLADGLEEHERWEAREERLMNATEAAKVYRVSVEKLKMLAANGWSQAVQVGDEWRYRRP